MTVKFFEIISVQYLTPGMAIYPPVYGAPTPSTMIYGPMYRIPQLTVDKSEIPSDHNRLASQAASVKAEPENIRAMSECSKRVRRFSSFDTCQSVMQNRILRMRESQLV